MTRVIGLMSGTSMDGVDAAVLETDGERIEAFGPAAFIAYSIEETALLSGAQGRWPDEGGLELVEKLVRQAHLRAIREVGQAELVGFHGQTLAHDPRGRGTHQTGRGDQLARDCGMPVVWDFRSADVSSGGEGAPLAPFFHFACARRIGATEPLAFLNLGGVGNVTWVDPSAEAPELPGALLAFDTGPGNALIDDFIRARRGQACDTGGELALSGRVDEEVVRAALDSPYLRRNPPKSLDRNEFHDVLSRVEHLSDADGAATLAAVTAACVASAALHFPQPVGRWLVCGGGRRNAAIMSMLARRSNTSVEAVETVGLDGDMLEAHAFAYLAERVRRGLPTSSPTTTGARLPVCGGRMSTP